MLKGKDHNFEGIHMKKKKGGEQDHFKYHCLKTLGKHGSGTGSEKGLCRYVRGFETFLPVNQKVSNF